MKRHLVSALLFFALQACITAVFAQDSSMTNKKNNTPFWDKVYVGGNLGLQFGNVTYIDISPLIGYKITPKFSAGLGVTYLYYSYNVAPVSFSTNVYGGRVFSRYFFTDNLFGHAEYELLNLESFDFRKRVDVESYLVGGGYNQPLGGKGFVSLLVLFNLNESVYSPYSNPIIRMGVGFGM